MKRRGRKKQPRRLIGDPADPHSAAASTAAFLDALRSRNYSPITIEKRQWHLDRFFAWCAERSITEPREVTKPVIDRYQRYLFYYRSANGRPLSFRSQHMELSTVRLFFKWLTRTNQLLYNPASEIEMPRLQRRLPKHVLSARETELVMSQTDLSTPIGVRDRAILEVLYSTGIRRTELTNLEIYDLDFDRGTLMIRQGKGKKDRLVPIGERAIAWVEKYLADVRPQFVVLPDEGVLFVTSAGVRFTPDVLGHTVREYVTAADIGKRGACHLFRHTMATLMLEGGADVRFVQEMLGHASLQATTIYTHVSIKKLQEIHAATHPGAKLERRRPGASDDEA